MGLISHFERSSAMFSSICFKQDSEVLENDLFWRVSQGKGVTQQGYYQSSAGGAAYEQWGCRRPLSVHA